MAEFHNGPHSGMHEVGLDPYGDMWANLGDGDTNYALSEDEDGNPFYVYVP